MPLVMLSTPSIFLKRWKKPWSLSETELVSTYGPVSKEQMANGSVLIKRYCRKKGHNTSISYTSGPNIITIRTTSTPPYSKEKSFNTTNQVSSPEKMGDG